MTFYIILRGPAGSGKTTLAEKLAYKYHAYHFNIDKIKKQNGLKHSEKEKLIVNKIIIPEAINRLKKEQVVIFDEVFYYNSQLKELEELPYEGYIFSLFSPLELCLERNRKRKLQGTRKTTDKGIIFVYDLVSKIEKGIIINTNQNIEDSFREIISYLPKSLS